MHGLTSVWCAGKLSVQALFSRGWGHAAFVQLTDVAQQGVAVDNRKRFDLWHWPSVCCTPWPTRLPLSLPPPLSLRVRQRADAYPHSCNQTWHHMHTPILSPLIKCVSLSGRDLSPVLLSISGVQQDQQSRIKRLDLKDSVLEFYCFKNKHERESVLPAASQVKSLYCCNKG